MKTTIWTTNKTYQLEVDSDVFLERLHGHCLEQETFCGFFKSTYNLEVNEKSFTLTPAVRSCAPSIYGDVLSGNKEVRVRYSYGRVATIFIGVLLIGALNLFLGGNDGFVYVGLMATVMFLIALYIHDQIRRVGSQISQLVSLEGE